MPQGILTGISPNGFSVTLNERNLGGSIIEDGLQAVLGGSSDVGQFLRQVNTQFTILKPNTLLGID